MSIQTQIRTLFAVTFLVGSAGLASGGPQSDASVSSAPSEAMPLDPLINGRHLGTDAALAAIIKQNELGKPIEWHVHGEVPVGPHKGEAILTENQRPVVILNGTDLGKKFKLAAGELLVGNISHDNQIWIARIPGDSVDKLAFVLCKFLPGTGHGMIRFKFTQPVQLVAKIHDREDGTGVDLEDLSTPVSLNDLFLSYEVAMSEGGPRYYSAKLGLKKTYASVFHFVSAQERALNYYQTGQMQQQWDLNYDASESDLTLKEALVTSHVLGYSQMYNTVTKNCIRCALEVPDRAVGFTNRKQTILGKLVELLAVFNSKVLAPEYFQRFVLLARGMRNPSLSPTKYFLETDLSLAGVYAEARKATVQSFAHQDLDTDTISTMTKQFGADFVRQIRCNSAW